MMSGRRTAELATVFYKGTSPLMTHIARLSILYEDLRLELAETLHPANRSQSYHYKPLYFIRRSLITLLEFHGCLIDILKSAEYKQAVVEMRIPTLGLELITKADRYFQNNKVRIKEFRNHLGGHLKPADVEHALKSFDQTIIGEIVIGGAEASDPALKLHFADQLVKGVIASRLPPETSLEQELEKAFEIIGAAQDHVMSSTYALVAVFLWHRFPEGPTEE